MRKQVLITMLICMGLFLCSCSKKKVDSNDTVVNEGEDAPLLMAGPRPGDTINEDLVESTYSFKEMNIELPSSYIVKEMAGFDGYVESPEIIIYFNKDKLSKKTNTISSVKQYADFVQKKNNLDVPIVEEDELTYFIYNYSTIDADFKYIAYVYKNNNAYWLVTFSTYEDSFEDLYQDIMNYASSVTFSS